MTDGSYTVCAFCGFILGQKPVKLLPVDSYFLITNNPCLPQRVISKLQYSESLWKMLQHETCLHFGSLGVMEIFWGGNHKILLEKITESWENCIIIFIIVSILNRKESFYNKCHRLSLYVSKTTCLLFWSFWSKMSRFL
jgi:hypothetical protein